MKKRLNRGFWSGLLQLFLDFRATVLFVLLVFIAVSLILDGLKKIVEWLFGR